MHAQIGVVWSAIVVSSLWLTTGCGILEPDREVEQPGSVLVYPEVEVTANVDRLTVRPIEWRVIFGHEPTPYLDVDPFPGALWLDAVPTDLSYQFARNQGIEFRLETDSGDRETVVLSGPSGPCWNHDLRDCNELRVIFANLSAVYELESNFIDLGARYSSVAEDQNDGRAVARVQMLDGALGDTHSIVARWPNVLSSDYVDYIPYLIPKPRSERFSGGIAVDFAEPNPGDQILQVDSGGVVTLIYQRGDDPTVLDIQLN